MDPLYYDHMTKSYGPYGRVDENAGRSPLEFQIEEMQKHLDDTYTTTSRAAYSGAPAPEPSTTERRTDLSFSMVRPRVQGAVIDGNNSNWADWSSTRRDCKDEYSHPWDTSIGTIDPRSGPSSTLQMHRAIMRKQEGPRPIGDMNQDDADSATRDANAVRAQLRTNSYESDAKLKALSGGAGGDAPQRAGHLRPTLRRIDMM